MKPEEDTAKLNISTEELVKHSRNIWWNPITEIEDKNIDEPTKSIDDITQQKLND